MHFLLTAIYKITVWHLLNRKEAHFSHYVMCFYLTLKLSFHLLSFETQNLYNVNIEHTHTKKLFSLAIMKSNKHHYFKVT